MTNRIYSIATGLRFGLSELPSQFYTARAADKAVSTRPEITRALEVEHTRTETIALAAHTVRSSTPSDSSVRSRHSVKCRKAQQPNIDRKVLAVLQIAPLLGVSRHRV